ncbi:MAG: vitamin B12-dependent ribonucleotide reductase, partial [Limisphaerales bacterium]
MLDARDSVVSSAPASTRRSAKTKSNPRGSSTKASSKGSSTRKLPLQRVFSDAKVKPFDQIEWDRRTAEITDDSGKTIFKQEGVEVPKNWSVLATKVVCSKYFYGDPAKAEREKSVKQLIHRVTRTIADWGVADGYFSKEDGEVFYDELTWLCVNQYGAFNSPVWF